MSLPEAKEAKDEGLSSSLERLVAEEQCTLRGLIAPPNSVDREGLERMIQAGLDALDRQVELLLMALNEHHSASARQGGAGTSLSRLEMLLDHTARLVHEAQVLQKLKGLLYNA